MLASGPRMRVRRSLTGASLRVRLGGYREGKVMMAPKHHLAFTPASRWVTRSSASEEQSEYTPSISTSAAQRPPPLISILQMVSTPPTSEPPPSSISPTHATPPASECASSSRIFSDPTRMAHVRNRQHQMMVQYDLKERLVGKTVMMAPKHHLAFTPASRWVTRSSASEEQSEYTPSISTSAAQRPPPLISILQMVSTPPTSEPPPSSISPTHATPPASECASSSRIFFDPTRMAHVRNRQHQMMVQYDLKERLVGKTVMMAPKHHLAFTPASRWVTRSSASEEQSEYTPSISTSAAQRPPPLISILQMVSTPPTSEPPPSSISPTHATPPASECASSSRIFSDPTRMAHVRNRQHQMMVQYDLKERLVGKTDQLDVLVSEDPDTSDPHDHLSQILGPKHSGRIRCSRKELEAALAWADHAATRADWAEERTSHLADIVRDMVSMLSVRFGGVFMSFGDILACIPSPALAPAPAPAPPPTRGPSLGDDDDVDLGDF
ncbi:hypothetical protein COCNU_02G009140 [Cocos nucifera]|uniref:Uncharacterized protein n=1 Tax=Cocos nucifera TaxID=13894 RepID=A0A8K0HZ37_COCNU|nr:hypothetical protein COCNU_02G009140 [Cocos nucifera]